MTPTSSTTASSQVKPQPLCASLKLAASLAGMCIAFGVQAQSPAHFRVHSWQPVTAIVSLQSETNSLGLPLKPQQTVPARDQLCLTNAAVGQTLVQLQPAEGGEARFIALGGQAPRCLVIGPAWARAQSGEAPWYKALFAQLGTQPGGVRISASTAGTTRGGATGGPEATQDPCGLYPGANGLVHVVSGHGALVLGTTLPSGTTVSLRRLPTDEAGVTTEVTLGLLHWPAIHWVAGDRWRISTRNHHFAQPSAGTASGDSQECGTTITVQPQSANPLRAAQEASQRFTADAATAQAALVAGQLDDANLAAWHAWLLSTVAPSEKTPQGIGPTLWRTWWNNHGASLPSPADGTR